MKFALIFAAAFIRDFNVTKLMTSGINVQIHYRVVLPDEITHIIFVDSRVNSACQSFFVLLDILALYTHKQCSK